MATQYGEKTLPIQRNDLDETDVTFSFEYEVSRSGATSGLVIISAILDETGEDIIDWFRTNWHSSGCTQEEWYADYINSYLN